MNKGGQRDQLSMQQPTGLTGPPPIKDLQTPLHPSQLLDNRTKNRRQAKEEPRESLIPEDIETSQQNVEEKKSMPKNESPGSAIKLELVNVNSRIPQNQVDEYRTNAASFESGVGHQKVIIPATSKPKLMSSDKKLDNRLKRNLAQNDPQQTIEEEGEGEIMVSKNGGISGHPNLVFDDGIIKRNSIDSNKSNAFNIESKNRNKAAPQLKQNVQDNTDGRPNNKNNTEQQLTIQQNPPSTGALSHQESLRTQQQTKLNSNVPEVVSSLKPNYESQSVKSLKIIPVNGNIDPVHTSSSQGVPQPNLIMKQQNLDMDLLENDLNNIFDKNNKDPQQQLQKIDSETHNVLQQLDSERRLDTVDFQTQDSQDKEPDFIFHKKINKGAQQIGEVKDGIQNLKSPENLEFVSISASQLENGASPIYSRNGSSHNKTKSVALKHLKSPETANLSSSQQILKIEQSRFNDSQISIKKPIVIPQKAIKLATNSAKETPPELVQTPPKPDIMTQHMQLIDQYFTVLRGSILAYTLEYDEAQLLSNMKLEIASIENQIKQQDEISKLMGKQISDNQKQLADYQCLSSAGKVTFLQEEHALRLERRQVDARLKQEQVEAGQNKIEDLESKLMNVEDQNDQLRVKTHMKKTDYEQYQEILKPYYNGVDVDIESLEKMKKEQKQIEMKTKDTIIQLGSLQKRANYDLKINRKRLTDEQIRIELETRQKQSHLESTIAKLKTQNEEIIQLKDLMKSFMTRKEITQTSSFNKMDSQSPKIEQLTFGEVANKAVHDVNVEPLSIPISQKHQKEKLTSISPRMLAANNPPAINVTEFKSNSEQEGDGLSKGQYSERDGKKLKLKLKLDRATSKVDHHRQGDNDSNLLSPVVKSRRSARNIRTKNFQKTNGSNMMHSGHPIIDDDLSYKSSQSLRHKKSSRSSQSGKKLNESQALSKSIRRRRQGKGSVIGKLNNFDDENEETSEELEEIYNILDVGLSAQGSSQRMGGSRHGPHKRMLPAISSPNQQSQGHGSSSYKLGSVHTQSDHQSQTSHTPQNDGNLLQQPNFNQGSGGQYRQKTDSSTTFKTQTMEQERSPMVQGSIPSSTVNPHQPINQPQLNAQMTQAQPRLAPLSIVLKNQMPQAIDQQPNMRDAGYPLAIKEEESKIVEDDEEIDNFEDMFGRASPVSKGGGMNLQNLVPYRGPPPNFSNQVSLQKEARKGEERASKESVNEVKFKANKQFFVKDDISN